MALNTYEYKFQDDVILVEEYIEPIDEETIKKVMSYSTKCLREENAVNYNDDETNPASLAYLLKHKMLNSIYFAYLNGEFQCFSATRCIENNTRFLCLVRTFSTIDNVRKPLNLAYILSLQLEFIKSRGYDKATFGINAGGKETLVKVINRRYKAYTHQLNSIKEIAMNNLQKFKYLGIQELNYCDQHVYEADLNE